MPIRGKKKTKQNTSTPPTRAQAQISPYTKITQSTRPKLQGQKPKGTGVPEEEEKKKGYEKIFEEIIVENFHKMEKEMIN